MERCIDIREIPDLAGLPSDDPRRRHLDSCPRCRGLAEGYGLFEDPGDTGDLADLSSADAELQRRLDAAMNVVVPMPAQRNRRRLWLAAAAVLAVCALGLATGEVLRLRQGSLPQVGERLRGEDGASGLAVVAGEDVLHLAWDGAPVAESYVVVFLAEDMREVGRRTSRHPRLDLAPGDVPAGAAFCQALAVSQGDTVVRSSVIPLQTDRN